MLVFSEAPTSGCGLTKVRFCGHQVAKLDVLGL